MKILNILIFLLFAACVITFFALTLFSGDVSVYPLAHGDSITFSAENYNLSCVENDFDSATSYDWNDTEVLTRTGFARSQDNSSLRVKYQVTNPDSPEKADWDWFDRHRYGDYTMNVNITQLNHCRTGEIG